MGEIITFILAILSEGFFSGSEIAIVSSDNSKLLLLAQSGDKKAKEVLKFKQNPIKFLTVCLIGTNLSAATASFFGTLFVLKHYPEFKELGVFFIIPVIMLFGEIIPKTIYSRFATPISLAIIRSIKFLSIILTPATFLLNKWSDLVSSFLKREEDFITKEEFYHMLENEKNCLPYHLQVIIDRFRERKDIEFALFGEKND